MKKTLIIGMLLAGGWAQASVSLPQTFNSGSSVGSIPEGNPVGQTFVGNFTSANPADVVLGLTVTLNVTGDYAANFFAYLIAPNGTHVTLLDFPGVSGDPLGIGNTTLGLNLTLATGGTAIDDTRDLNNGGTYAPYGSLADFNGSLANGNWTLYFVDATGGLGSPTLNSWTLDITVVPEPVTWALAAFGLVFVGVGAGRFYFARRRSTTAG
jgi:subtilisin-like proprotein convertase family protein